MKMICDCGQEMKLRQSVEKDEKGRKMLHHANHNEEEIKIYEFKKFVDGETEHAIGFYCNGCEQLFLYNVEHRN